MNPISFAVVGCGHIGKRHIAMVKHHPEAILTAVCDILPQEFLGLDIPIDVPFFSSITQLLLYGPNADVICICTPNGMHELHAIEALRAGRHVIIEKPMALTRAGCERILFEALNRRKEVFCVMQNRYSPPAVWLKDLVNQDILGEIYLIQMSLFWNRDHRYYTPQSWHGNKKQDGGALFTQFSHFIDLLYWVFGEIRVTHASIYNLAHPQLEIDDSGVAHFQREKGGAGSLSYTTAVWDRNMESSMTVIGEKGTVKISGQYMNEISYVHVQDYTMPQLPPTPAPNDYGGYQGSAANHHHVFQNVIEVLQGQGMITTNALEGLKTVEIIENIYRKGLQSETKALSLVQPD